MIYEWKCRECGLVLEVMRDKEQWNKPPTEEEIDGLLCLTGEAGNDVDFPWQYHDWFRYISTAPAVPFRALRDRGVFMDEHGNYPPRKI